MIYIQGFRTFASQYNEKELDLYFADFNHDSDPHAAQEVIMSGARVVLVGKGFDRCLQIFINKKIKMTQKT